jgi:hypothetical protein
MECPEVKGKQDCVMGMPELCSKYSFLCLLGINYPLANCSGCLKQILIETWI